MNPPLRVRLARSLGGDALERDIARHKTPGIHIGAVGRFRCIVPPDQTHLASISGVTMLDERIVTHPQLSGMHLVSERPVDWWGAPTEATGDEVEEWLRSREMGRPNAFVNLGLHFLLDRLFNINTPNTSISHIGVSNDTITVTASTLLIDPAPAGTTSIVTLASGGTGAPSTTRSAETVSCGARWDKSGGTNNFNAVFNKTGLFNTSTDAGDDTTPTVEGVMNIIGGTGGSSPYNEPFSIDLTALAAYTVIIQQDITPTAT